MKLLFCTYCQDIFKLDTTSRVCKCGRSGGVYLGYTNAVYFGKYAVPLGFANNSLANAILNQPQIGKGLEFTAFVIPRKCPTFQKQDEKNEH